jgi:hypothetical protein
MRNPTSPRMAVAATEDLLDGRGAPTPLRGLLAAAAAPGRAEELTGEATARAAFVAAARAAGASPTSPVQQWVAPSRPIAGKLLVGKVLAFTALAAGATGGVALAANSSLARPFVTTHPSTGAPHSVTGARRAPETSAATTGATSAATSGPTLTSTPAASSSGVRSTGTVARPGEPSPRVTPVTAKARADASPCAPGSTADGCGQSTGDSPQPTGGATISRGAAGSPATAPPAVPPAAPLAAAPLAPGPSATPAAQAEPPSGSHGLDRVDNSQGNPAGNPFGGGPD